MNRNGKISALVITLLLIFSTLAVITPHAEANFDTSNEKAAAVTVFTEDFEGVFPGSWYIGDVDANSGDDYWDDTSYKSYGGYWSGWCADVGTQHETGEANNVAHQYDDDMGAFIYREVSLESYSSASLSYMYWIDCESSYDYLQVIYYSAGSWFYVDTHTGYSAGWQYSTVDVPTSATIVGFFFVSDLSVHSYEGAYIDDIALTAEAEGDEYFYSVVHTPFDSDGDDYDDAVEVRMDVDTTDGTVGVYVDAYLIDPYGSSVDSDFLFWYITGSAVEYGYAYLYVPPGSPGGWYDVELWLYDEDVNYEDYSYVSDVLYYPGPEAHDEYFWSAYPWSFDDSGDGYDDAVYVEMDVDTTYSGTLGVYVVAYFIDPYGTWGVDVDSPNWYITDAAVEYGYAYLYVPAGSPEGWYDVELWLYDEWGNYEDYRYLDDAAYLYPPDIIPPEAHDEYFYGAYPWPAV
jgi:hypothetical protein